MQYSPLSLSYKLRYPLGVLVSDDVVDDGEQNNRLEVCTIGSEVVEHRILGLLSRSNRLYKFLDQLSFIGANYSTKHLF